jgi:hypothetical protein
MMDAVVGWMVEKGEDGRLMESGEVRDYHGFDRLGVRLRGCEGVREGDREREREREREGWVGLAWPLALGPGELELGSAGGGDRASSSGGGGSGGWQSRE